MDSFMKEMEKCKYCHIGKHIFHANKRSKKSWMRPYFNSTTDGIIKIKYLSKTCEKKLFSFTR